MAKHWQRDHEEILHLFNRHMGFYLKDDLLPRDPLPLWFDVLYINLLSMYGE
jgi:hypothetical protein